MNKVLALTSACLLVAAGAQAQYAKPAAAGAPGSPVSVAPKAWEADVGLGYVFAASPSGLDNGVNAHLGGYYLAAADATRETTMKVGAELLHSSIDLDAPGNNTFDSNFLMVNGGVAYRLSRTFEVGVLAGVGLGRHDIDSGGRSDSTNAFAFQVRPELTAHLNDTVSISFGYRYLRSSFLDNDFKNSSGASNAGQHSFELSAKVRF